MKQLPLALLVLLLAACTVQQSAAPSMVPTATGVTTVPSPAGQLPTAGAEAFPSPPAQAPYPKDCTPTLPDEALGKDKYTAILEPFDVVGPAGNRLYGLILRPDPAAYSDQCFPAVVLVPGGINPGRTAAYADDAQMLAAAGMVVLTFNAAARVDTRSPEDLKSEGEEGYNGFGDQDDLCAVVRYAVGLDYVIAENVGISSHSFGISTAAGCAGRQTDLPIKYIVDNEGPPDSFVICHEPSMLDDDPSNDMIEKIHEILGRYSVYRDPSDENTAFWAEREAVRFIGNYRGRYLRLQATWDHAQPPEDETQVVDFQVPPLWWQNKHTTDIVNAAVAGGVPWVRVNLPEQRNAVNATFDMAHPPTYLPGALKDKPWTVRAILEMARMP